MPQSVTTRSFGGEAVPFRQFVDGLHREVPAAEVLLLSTLPRGGVQIVQPQKLSDSFLKGYTRQWHTEDDATWRAISSGKASASHPQGRYVEQFLQPFGFQYAVSAMVCDPVLPGYVGAMQVLRTTEQGPFTPTEVNKITELAEQFSQTVKEVRSSRTVLQGAAVLGSQPVDIRFFALNEMGEPLLFKAAFDRLDPQIRQQLIHEATARGQKGVSESGVVHRLLLPDTAGDHWVVNAIAFAKYPALSSAMLTSGAPAGSQGAVVFFSILPGCDDWAMVRSSDFQADAEMARLVPSMKFMLQEYHRGPTLTEISKIVHLSPFHFHRRFSELFGLTPKHFLLECQIQDAKNELLSGAKELAKIAKDCGFAHQSHFTSRFKQATGLTPTRWRRMANTRASAR